MGILLVLVAVYVGFSIQLVQGDYAQEELRSDITRIEQDGVALQVKLSEAASLNAILARTKDLAYTEIDVVRYIKKSSRSPFAVR